MDEPAQRLPKDARGYWRVLGLVRGGGLVVAGVVLSMTVVAWLPLLAGVLGLVVLAGVLPELWWRRWRYEVRDDEIDLMRGALVVRRTLIPIRRVQHVDTETGPLQDSFGLASVRFHTAAGAVEIPALTKGEAEAVRARVGALTRTRDDV